MLWSRQERRKGDRKVDGLVGSTEYPEGRRYDVPEKVGVWEEVSHHRLLHLNLIERTFIVIGIRPPIHLPRPPFFLHVLIPRTCECATLYFADVIKLMMWKWGDYFGLSQETQSNHGVLTRMSTRLPRALKLELVGHKSRNAVGF